MNQRLPPKTSGLQTKTPRAIPTNHPNPTSRTSS